MNQNYSMSPPAVSGIDSSPNDERVKVMEQNYARQSRTLRLSQLNTAPAKKEEGKFSSPNAFEIEDPDNNGLEDMVASKDALLMRCKTNIEELQSHLDKEKYF